MNFSEYLIRESFTDIIQPLVKAVEMFVFKNDKKYIKDIVKYKNQIPPMFKSSQKLYRGMIFDENTINDIKEGKNIKLDDYSSWTTNSNVAKRFISDKSKSVGKTGKGLIFVKSIPSNKIILNIQGLILYLDSTGMLDQYGFDDLNKEMAIEEAEVICDKGITVSKKDIFMEIK